MTTPSTAPATRAAFPHASHAASAHAVHAASAPLRALLDDATHAGPDSAAWQVLARRARVVTAQLADVGWLPGHLVVEVTDPSVVVARTLAVAYRVLLRSSAPTAVLGRTRCA